MSRARELLKAAVFLAFDGLGVNAVFRRVNRGKIKVLLYHGVCETPDDFPNAIDPGTLEKQLSHLRRHYNPVTLSPDGRWVGLRDDRVNVLLTFDDGFENNRIQAWSCLKKHGISACFFLITDCVADGSPPAFASRYPGPARAYRTIEAQGARDLLAQGASIGSHGTDHRDYSALGTSEALADAHASKAALTTVLGNSTELFAFPWGKHRQEQLMPLADVYRRVFTVEHGFNSAEDRFLRRNEVTGTLHMHAAASGALDALSRLLGRARPSGPRIS
jgi:peptidoglycan/xylan/chitin deacetylase (PgdA/CDA1 family)